MNRSKKGLYYLQGQILLVVWACFFSIQMLAQSIETKSQTELSSESYESILKENEKIEEIKAICRIKVSDKRLYQNNKIDLVKINNALIKSFTEADIELQTEIEDGEFPIKPIVLNVKVEYCNYFESNYDNLYLKAIIKVEMEKGGFLLNDYKFDLLSEVHLPKNKVSQIGKVKYQAVFESAEKQLLQDVSVQFKEKTTEKLKQSLLRIYSVTSFGKTIYDNSNIDKTKALATNDALMRATSKVFGFKISSETTIVDLGAVTDVVNQSSEGRVIQYSIEPSYSKITSDGYYYILVNSMLKSN